MVDYEKMTKQQLIEQLEEKTHLAEAVKSKDMEIAEIKRQLSNTVPKEKYEDAMRRLQNVVDKKKYEEIEQLLKSYEGGLRKEQVEDIIRRYEQERNMAMDIANHYIQAHRDTLRLFKIGLDISISHEELISQKIPKKEQ